MMQVSPPRMIHCLAVCGLDPRLTISSSPEQKWITSLEFIKQSKDVLTSSDREKHVQLVPGLYLKISFNQVGKLPVNQLEVVDLDIHDASVRFSRQDWIPVCINGEQKQFKDMYREKNINIRSLADERKNPGQALVLCYHCDESTENAITDIGILKAEKGRGEKDVFNVPQGYKMLNHTFSHKGRNKYLVYKRASNKLQLNYTPMLLQCYPIKPSDSKISLELLPHFCFPEGVRLSQEMRGFVTFSFILSSVSRIYCSCMVIKELLPLHLKKKLGLKQEKVYFEKALCIVSEYSYPQQFCQVLQHLYRISMSKNDVPFYVVIEQLVENLLMVSPEQLGKVAITYPYGGCNVTFYTSLNYPVVSQKSIYCLCKFLSVANVVFLYEALLLQKQIFLVSQSKTAIQAILFPFKWEHVLIPVLPSSLEQYTEAIVPFIIGIPPSLTNLQKEQCVFLDIDHNEFVNGQEMPPLPDKLQKQLVKRLQSYQYYVQEDVQEYLENPENTYIFQMKTIDYPEFDPYDVRDAFLEFNLSLMKNYNKFWNKSKKEALYKDRNESLKEINELFSIEGFLDDLNMTKIGSFGYKFTETSIFTHFIEKRCRNPQDPYFAFFDECIERKKKKKETHCLVQIKPEKFRVTPPPVWDSSKEKTYRYESFPSILQDNEEIDFKEIQLQIDIENEQENQKHTIFNRLLEKHSIYKGLFEPIGEEISIALEKLNLQTEIETLAYELLNKEHLQLLIQQINQMSEIKRPEKSQQMKISDMRGLEVDLKSKRDLRALELIDHRLSSQIQQVHQYQRWFQLLEPDQSKTLFKDLSHPDQTHQKQSFLIVYTLLQDVKYLRGSKHSITFDNRRSSSILTKNTINIVIHNTSTKQLLNSHIHKQPKKFYSFVVQRIHEEQVVWVFDHFLQLKDWKS